jgi:hypothetical protein
VLLLLAMAYAQSDVDKARDLEKQLPTLGDVGALNAEELEKLPGTFFFFFFFFFSFSILFRFCGEIVLCIVMFA